MNGNNTTSAATGSRSGDSSQAHRSGGHLMPQKLSPGQNLPWQQPNPPPPYYPHHLSSQRVQQAPHQHGSYQAMLQHPQLSSHSTAGSPSPHTQEFVQLPPFQQGAVWAQSQNVHTPLTLPPISSSYQSPAVDNAPPASSPASVSMSSGHYAPPALTAAGLPYVPVTRTFETHNQHVYNMSPHPVPQFTPPPHVQPPPQQQIPASAAANTSGGSTPQPQNGVTDANGTDNSQPPSTSASACDGPPKKKMHFKSRNGCLICKKRKIKCDEARPKCRNCVKHGASCEYAKEVLEYGFSTTVPGHFVGPPPGLSAHSTIVSPDLNMQHLSLLMHYVVHTSHSLSNVQSADNISIWSQTVPLVACRFPFLMYSIFALAATHILATTALNSTDGEDKDHAAKRQEHEALGVYYRQRALEAFRSAINEQRSHDQLQAALFASVLLSIDAFAYQEENNPESEASGEPNYDGDADSPSRQAGHQQKLKTSEPQIISIDRWIQLHKGIGAVLMEWRLLDVESEIFSQWNLNWTILPLGERKLQYLSDMIEEHYPDSVKICDEPIKLLEQLITFQSMEFGHMVGGGIVRYLLAWPFRCSDEFIARLRSRNRVALAVHIHFLTVLRLASGPKWWPELTTRKDIRTIARILGKEWEPWFQWPRKQLPFEIFP
ncbi:hypothetical protein V1525DRAFT_407028 [Lipomyces kononenkoae]|uniref:Uncharacterized protein n=1 Tax=Lipomyces kononenkoae TaxID=34357 RepID=A0ACC3SXR2_LIPKO